VITELDRLATERGTYPAVLRCDNGPEFACGVMADWADGNFGLHVVAPGEPWRNGCVESFNSRIRDECLNIRSFWSLAPGQGGHQRLETRYNQHRRHSGLGYQPPTATSMLANTDQHLAVRRRRVDYRSGVGEFE